jgi:hypothetical protein
MKSTGIRLLIVDGTARKGLLDEFWSIGAFVAHATGFFDATYRAKNWSEALGWLTVNAKRRAIDEVHIWGHGNPGVSWLGLDRIDADTIRGKHKMAIAELCGRIGLIWFRQCSVFQGSVGQRLASDLAYLFGATVAGHTREIGFPWHSGLCMLEPSHAPNWSVEDAGKSGCMIPRTVFFARQSLPSWCRS